ncbi:hypothetical protein MLD38_038759 [Melastoma candidum]|uniref:Uncharacterized protein n=1 Tax=Melastoma candidum TaxID=119954 RepID=A0ACB9L288_9MYRT|nr:hypothetical protein MLD38_038759 [Melastoma candidum]
MFTNDKRQEERTGRSGTPRAQFLQNLVNQFQNATTEEMKEKIVANLANFAYDPYNFLNVLELFLDCLTVPNEKLKEFGAEGICNTSVDPTNAAMIARYGGIPLIIECLHNPVRNTVNYALGSLYYLCNPSNKEEILKPEVTDRIKAYASAEATSVTFSNLAKTFQEEAKNTLGLKLLVDKHCKKVLFAEAGKDFIDFLFHLMTLPVGTVIRLLKPNGMVGCVGDLYRSIRNINDVYMESAASKKGLLKPQSPSGGESFPLLLPDSSPSDHKTFYKCSNCRSSPNVADFTNATCNDCGNVMKQKVVFLEQQQVKAGASNSSGYVKGVVTYMVMDNLEVKPMSTISSIAVLNKFNVKDVGALEEKVIAVSMNEALELLKTSLCSKNVLTDVFYRKLNFKSRSCLPPPLSIARRSLLLEELFTNDKRRGANREEWNSQGSIPAESGESVSECNYRRFLDHLAPGYLSEQLNVLELFLDCLTVPNEKLKEFGAGGICNTSVDPTNAAMIAQYGGIPLIIECLHSPVRNTKLQA